MSDDLAGRRCKPCEGGTSPLTREQCDQLLLGLDSGWSISEDQRSISRQFKFAAYDQSLAFANAAAWVAIVEDHHPVLTVEYGSCTVCYTTHAINGLSDNDFICAAKLDRLAAMGSA